MYMNNKSTNDSFGLVNQTGWTRPKAFKNNRNNQQWKIPTDNNEHTKWKKQQQQRRTAYRQINNIKAVYENEAKRTRDMWACISMCMSVHNSNNPHATEYTYLK